MDREGDLLLSVAMYCRAYHWTTQGIPGERYHVVCSVSSLLVNQQEPV